MTREEFAPILAYLSAGVGKPMPRETAEVYFDLLGDLSAVDLLRAVRQALREHKYASFPTIAVLRELATGVNGTVERIKRCLPARCHEPVNRLTGSRPGAITMRESSGSAKTG